MIKLTYKSKPRNFTKEESLLVLNMIVVKWELLTLLDELKHTAIYRHKIKMLVNQLLGELTSELSGGILDMWGVEDEALYELMETQKSIIQQISKLRPDLQFGLNELMKHFFNAPELVLHRNGIKF